MLKRLKSFLVLIIIIAAGLVYYESSFNLGLDLQGGTQLVLEAKDTEDQQVDQDALLGALAVIRNRVDGLGVSEPLIQQKGQRQIIVQLPGIKDPDRAINLVGQTAQLKFVTAEWAPRNVDKLDKEKQEKLLGKGAKVGVVSNYSPTGELISERPIILRDTVMTGKDLKTAMPGTNSLGEFVVNIEFTKDGAKKFEQVTRKSVGRPLAIVLDDTIISAPNVNEAISGGSAQISGSFSLNEMKDLVIKLKAGALPVPVEIVSNKVVGPTLGRDSIEKSKKAAIVGISILLVFMLLVYRLPGLMANIALLIYILLAASTLKLFDATLTLPGIAGLILTMGMAVDANVIIFERIKEERKIGHPIDKAIDMGFSRAFIAIIDANITTLIAAGVLFWLGTGTIKGFAVSLSVGIVMSMFSAIVITRILLKFLTSITQHPALLFRGE